HLFVSRWPKMSGFPSDYRAMSEIVRATSPDITGPYEFREVVIGERDSTFWDSNMAHNPTIHKIDNTYVLFYIGSDFTTMQEDDDNLLRRVGYATATSIFGPWERNDQPAIDEESNNPAVLINDLRGVVLMFRDTELRIKVATAPELSGPYTMKNDDVWPECRLEDFYLFNHHGQHRMICEDNTGRVSGYERWGVQFSSPDGINWDKCNDLVVYDHDIHFMDGTILHCTRRERPQLYLEEGRVVSLITAVYDGNNSWCQPVLLDPGY
ncbi:glycoside hydrolase family protein, partial [Bacteroidota bacterium]